MRSYFLKYYLLMVIMFLTGTLRAQTSTEVFETESHGSISFTDNGVIFNIISHSGTFAVLGNNDGALAGWNGTALDNRYIDNSSEVPLGSSFSIKTTSNLFKANRFWILVVNDLGIQNVTGTVTVTGKLSGITKFTHTKSTGFSTSLGSTNGYTLIDLTNLSGQNYSNVIIDELRITLGGAFQYVCFDAFTWVKNSGVILPDPTCNLTTAGTQRNVSCIGGSDGTATVSVSGGSGNYTYSWTNNSSKTATASGLTAGNYSVTVTDGSQCQKTQGFTIIEPPKATIAYAGSPYCASGQASVTQTGTTGGTYSSTTGLTIDESTGAINLASSTAGTYTVSYTYGSVCPAIATASVTVNALSTATIAYSGSPYQTTGIATVTHTGAQGGIYSSTTGLDINALTGAVNLALSTPGSYTVTYTFGDAPCSNSTTATIVVSASTISFSGTITPFNTTYGTASTAGSIQVSGLGLISGITVAPSSTAVFEVSSNGTNYSPSVTIGSSGNVTGVVYVRLKANAPAGTYTGSISLTSTGANSSTVLIPSSTVSKAILTYAANTVSKVYGDNIPTLSGTVTGFVNAETMNSATTGTLTWPTSATGTTIPVGSYAVNGGGLSATNYTFVQAVSNASALTITKAVLTVTANSSGICQFEGLPTLGLSYSGFKYNDTENSLRTKPTVSPVLNSNIAGSYTLVPSGGVSDNYSFNYSNGVLTINALPVAEIVSSRGNSVSKGETLTLTASGGSSYAWTSTSGIPVGQTMAVLTIKPEQTTTYTVMVTNANGCHSSKSITILVEENYNLIATNILTPNGDGMNDTWEVKNIDMYPKNEVKIFDRGGRMLYAKKGYDNSWNGVVDGSPLGEGTYYYVITYGADKLVQKGYITIVINR